MAGAAIDAAEAERIIREFRTWRMCEVASPAWLAAHAGVAHACVCAHACAHTRVHDVVLSAMLTFDKLGTLVHSVLLCEAWREHVLPELCTLQRGSGAPVLFGEGGSHLSRTYFVLYHEALCANLLELMLYHDYAAEALGDALLDLCDYAVRQVNALIASTHAHTRTHTHTHAPAHAGTWAAWLGPPEQGAPEEAPSVDPRAAAERIARDAGDPVRAGRAQLRAWLSDLGFRRGVACVSILRYLAEHVAKLPLSVAARVLDTHDVMLTMVPLIENPPWVRKLRRPTPPTADPPADGAPAHRAGVQWQKYIDQGWVDVATGDLLKLTPLEAQPWLTLYNLMCEPGCRKRYAMHSHRKGTLLRVRKYLNEVLVDQIPMLADVQRYLDELSLMAVPAATDAARGGLLLEAVPEIQDRIVAEALAPLPRAQGARDAPRSGMLFITETPEDAGESDAAPAATRTWPDVARDIADTVFRADRPRDDLTRLASTYNEDVLDELLGAPKCYRCGGVASKRCSRCKNVWYCGRECQVADWKDHKSLCDVVTAGQPVHAGEHPRGVRAPSAPVAAGNRSDPHAVGSLGDSKLEASEIAARRALESKLDIAVTSTSGAAPKPGRAMLIEEV